MLIKIIFFSHCKVGSARPSVLHFVKRICQILKHALYGNCEKNKVCQKDNNICCQRQPCVKRNNKLVNVKIFENHDHLKGLVTMYANVKCKSHIYFGSKVMAKEKIVL